MHHQRDMFLWIIPSTVPVGDVLGRTAILGGFLQAEETCSWYYITNEEGGCGPMWKLPLVASRQTCGRRFFDASSSSAPAASSPGRWRLPAPAPGRALLAALPIDAQGEDGRDEDGAPHRHQQEEEAGVGAARPSHLRLGHVARAALLALLEHAGGRRRGHGLAAALLPATPGAADALHDGAFRTGSSSPSCHRSSGMRIRTRSS